MRPTLVCTVYINEDSSASVQMPTLFNADMAGEVAACVARSAITRGCTVEAIVKRVGELMKDKITSTNVKAPILLTGGNG